MTFSACLPTSSEWMISESLIKRNLIDNKPYDILQFSNIFSALMLADVVFLEFLGGYRITHGAVQVNQGDQIVGLSNQIVSDSFLQYFP